MPSILFLGASSDIAIATAKVFAKQHYDIQLAGRDIDYLNKVKTDLEIRYDIHSATHLFDALQFSTHKRLIAELQPLPDITVCAFGYLGDQITAQNEWDEAKRILDTNLTGAMSVLNEIAGRYEKNKKGIIAGISSVAGERGRKSNYIYGAAKAGFTAYLSGLRHRLFASGVHVITIKPGFVRTKMTDHLDLPGTLTATPQEVAEAIKRAVLNKKNTVYVKPLWKYVMFIIRHLPENIFKRTKL